MENLHKSIISFVISGCLLLLSFSLSAQALPRVSKSPPLSERLFFGGNFGMQFGTYTNIEASPLIGIWLLPRLSIAAGPTFQYYKDPYGRTNIYGGRSFLRFTVIQDMNNFIPIGISTSLFLHSEYEGLSLKSDFWMTNIYDNSRFFVHSVLAGPGISQAIGPKASVNFMVLWVLTETEYEIYSNPEIRVGFNF